MLRRRRHTPYQSVKRSATMDNNPLLPATPWPARTSSRLLDTYVSANVANWMLHSGKQSLWWGPGEGGGALLFSDNAEPIYMARASRIAPFRLPLDPSMARPDEVGSVLRKTFG